MSGGGGYQLGQPSQPPGGLQPLQMLQSFRQNNPTYGQGRPFGSSFQNQPQQQPQNQTMGGYQPQQQPQNQTMGGYQPQQAQQPQQQGQNSGMMQAAVMPPSYGSDPQAPMTGGKFGGPAPMQNANGMGMPEFGSAAQSSPQQGQTPGMTGGK